jgi:hypothetical protein
VTAEASQSASAEATPTATDATLAFPIVDTGQTSCYSSEGAEIDCPAASEADYGQPRATRA